MTQGVTAPLKRYRAPFHQGLQWWTPEVPQFDVAMTQGVHPDRYRLTLGPRIPQPVSQTTHVAAPLSVEMTAGAAPTRNRAFTPPKIGWSVSQPTHVSATFSVEMTAGVTAPRFRYRAPSHQGAQWWTPEVEAFGIEQVQGSRPDRNRQRLGPRLGQPVSQPTHTAAPFSVEMTQGIAVLRTRQRNDIRMRSGWSVPPNPGPDAIPVTEVTSGPHRYLWMPAHLRAQPWNSHLRAVEWSAHPWRTMTWDAHTRLFTWTFHRRDD